MSQGLEMAMILSMLSSDIQLNSPGGSPRKRTGSTLHKLEQKKRKTKNKQQAKSRKKNRGKK